MITWKYRENLNEKVKDIHNKKKKKEKGRRKSAEDTDIHTYL